MEQLRPQTDLPEILDDTDEETLKKALDMAANNIVHKVRNFEEISDRYNDEIERLRELRDTATEPIATDISTQKAYAIMLMKRLGMKTFHSLAGVAKTRDSKSLEFSGMPSEIPEEYVRVKVIEEPEMKKVKEALKDGTLKVKDGEVVDREGEPTGFTQHIKTSLTVR